jgi:very-short-patch-repair endonuclease
VPAPTAAFLCQSDLERQWLDYLEQQHYNLPSHSQKLIEACHTRPDFFFEKDNVAIYVDGYHHLFRARSATSTAECMKDCGYTVIRFDC